MKNAEVNKKKCLISCSLIIIILILNIEIEADMDSILRTNLQDYGFQIHNPSAKDYELTRDNRECLNQLATLAKKEICSILKSEILPLEEKIEFYPSFSNTLNKDILIFTFSSENDQIEIVVDESTITITLIPEEKIEYLQLSEVKKYYHLITNKFLKNVFKSDTVTIKDMTDYWLIKKVLLEKDTKKIKYIPWTWMESVLVAVAKNGGWISFSIQRLPEVSTSMPAGGKYRISGSWFENECK